MSSYAKNTQNNSGITIDNLQVNQSAYIPNLLTQNGDYVGENAISGSKAFKNNVTFQNGITAAIGSSTINNLTVTGAFSLPNGSFVDTTTTQSISGDKTFNGKLTSNSLNISGLTPVSNNAFSSTVVTTQTGSITGTTLTLSSLNSSIAVGQQITFYNPINSFQYDKCLSIDGNLI